MIAKACPFCGSVPELRRHLHAKDMNGKKWFLFGGDKAKGKWQWNTYTIRCKSCKVRPSVNTESEDQSLVIWNDRTFGEATDLESVA